MLVNFLKLFLRITRSKTEPSSQYTKLAAPIIFSAIFFKFRPVSAYSAFSAVKNVVKSSPREGRGKLFRKSINQPTYTIFKDFHVEINQETHRALGQFEVR